MNRCKYVVKRTYLILPDSELSITLDTPQWFDFLESGINSFHYIYSRDYTFRATLRGGAEYWYGEKTVLNLKRTLYIGKSESLTVERLGVIARTINLHELAWRTRNE
ncbi:hypothetical protein [Nostoc sp. TCL26-01]|uniref:hypothetical protein n=1 Tax=Nostoc sp. TCL26-01 TaxID=2576904 RepID=UPI0015C07FB9|nr:hypothetical protein [Nostoc sp. TCL26-01]QLE58750.1 hypothetical protein FD725_26555 [Nostoc sp. TCL26-01]